MRGEQKPTIIKSSKNRYRYIKIFRTLAGVITFRKFAFKVEKSRQSVSEQYSQNDISRYCFSSKARESAIHLFRKIL